jgi:hypothetical protein
VFSRIQCIHKVVLVAVVGPIAAALPVVQRFVSTRVLQHSSVAVYCTSSKQSSLIAVNSYTHCCTISLYAKLVTVMRCAKSTAAIAACASTAGRAESDHTEDYCC